MILSKLDYGAYLTYTPKGKEELAKKSINIMYCLKNEGNIGNPPEFMSQYVTKRIKNTIDELPFNDFFSKDTFLVPVPKSSLMKENTLWVPKKIAEAMSILGMGKCYPCLVRTKTVKKSAYCNPSERPSAEDHFNSIECKSILHSPKKIVLIDDVVTRGTTLIGCASRLFSFFGDIPIKAFAIMRTISNSEDFKNIQDPCIGTIENNAFGTFRRP